MSHLMSFHLCFLSTCHKVNPIWYPQLILKFLRWIQTTSLHPEVSFFKSKSPLDSWNKWGHFASRYWFPLQDVGLKAQLKVEGTHEEPCHESWRSIWLRTQLPLEPQIFRTHLFLSMQKDVFFLRFRFDGFFDHSDARALEVSRGGVKWVKRVFEVGSMIKSKGLKILNCICNGRLCMKFLKRFCWNFIPTGSLRSWSMVVATFAVFLGCHLRRFRLLGGTSPAEICIRSLDVLLASQELMKSSTLRQLQYYDSILIQCLNNSYEVLLSVDVKWGYFDLHF